MDKRWITGDKVQLECGSLGTLFHDNYIVSGLSCIASVDRFVQIFGEIPVNKIIADL
jgi:hypothetical protein